MTDFKLDELETTVKTGAHGSGTPMIGTNAGDLTGVSIAAAEVNRSPCAQLKWLEDNTPYNYKAFVELAYNEGYQGVRIINKSDDSLAKEVKFEITGGDDADPYRQIPINHRRMVTSMLGHILDCLESE